MPMGLALRDVAARLQWRRGGRAAVAVLAAVLVCRGLGRPFGWAALGAFEAILVDNGGPYRSRLHTMLTVLAGGAVAGMLGSLVGGWLAAGSGPEMVLAVLATAGVMFGFTFARVLTQPLASTSVIILVLYFAGLGGREHTMLSAAVSGGYFVAGGLGAALVSLGLWPLDPFRPARHAVARVYGLLSGAMARLAAGWAHPDSGADAGDVHAGQWKREVRREMEAARAALSVTGARAPARTGRARSLAVLLETGDMLFARAIRLTELAAFDARGAEDGAESPGVERRTGEQAAGGVRRTAEWLTAAEKAVAVALHHAPADGAASFAREGSHTVQFLGRREVRGHDGARGMGAYLAAEERGAREELLIAFEAVRALWTGDEGPRGRREREALAAVAGDGMGEAVGGWAARWMDKVRGEWSLESTMLRHALRMAVVAAVDVLLLRFLHLSHGFWLAMTSIIVLQPSGSGTMRRGMQRVGGTVAGGMLAAVLAAAIHSEAGIIAVMTVSAGLTLASFAVDYGVYCFFLTPTFVLMSLPYLRDWRYAGVRVETTVLGAAVAVLAMRLLWPQREDRELAGLLGAGAEANGEYLRTMLRVWRGGDAAAQKVLAAARRGCGLASNAAEETLDRLLLEPTFGRKASAGTEHGLAFTTYLRRLTQAVTTLAAHGAGERGRFERRVEALILRLERLGADGGGTASEGVVARGYDCDLVEDRGVVEDFAEMQMQRMERQVGVLERTAAAMAQGAAAAASAGVFSQERP